MKFIHFSGLEKKLNCKDYKNILLSCNSNENYFNNYKYRKNFYISNFWHKNQKKLKKKVLIFRKILLRQLKNNLNSLHNINYSIDDWEILLEPWLNNYLQTSYFRWLIVDDLIKKFGNFKYLEISTNKIVPAFDTLQFSEFDHKHDVFNHLNYQDILKFRNKDKNKVILKKINFKLDNNEFIHVIYNRIKKNFFFNLYEILLEKLFKIEILINIKTKKSNFLKLCNKLKVFPFKGLNVFDRSKLINICNKKTFSNQKRNKFSFPLKAKNNFDNYILKRINFDIPRVFIENFHDVINLHHNRLENVKFVITDTMHEYNPVFKSWLVAKKRKTKNFKIFSSNHGGSYGTNLKIFDYNKIKSFQNINYSSRKFNKDINLPCLFLSKKKSGNSDKILIITHDNTKYPSNFFKTTICEEANEEFIQLENFFNHANNLIKDNIFIRPYFINSSWNLSKKYHKIIKSKNILYDNHEYKKLINDASIKIVTYPQTAFLESLINGPTFLLFNRKHYYENKKNSKLMEKLFKNKIAFEDGRKLAKHINYIKNDVNKWWSQKKIQTLINSFLAETNKFDDNAIIQWTKFFKKIIKQEIS